MSRRPQLTIDANTRAQGEIASNPHHSAWVSANAGSGKTFVLTRRVVRLLLDGNDPSRILCLTFTKAAAGEMANRVFERLGAWAVLPDDALHAVLTEIEDRPPSADKIVLARTLFARALETPGGLKIQTIHAFCEALLHQFPLEANVPGSFSVMDDAAQARLLKKARQAVWLDAAGDPDGAIGSALSAVMDFASDTAIEKAVEEIVGQRETLSNWLQQHDGPDGAVATTRQALGFGPEDTVEALEERVIADSLLSADEWLELRRTAAGTGEKTATKIAEAAGTIGGSADARSKIAASKSILLTAQQTPRKFSSYPSKAIEGALPGIREKLEAEALRLQKALARVATLRTIDGTKPLLVLAQAILQRYQRTKRERGLLDYDDLVARTADLLTRSEARQWVHYKLDLGIDHVLLDEAQDTSPRQWDVIVSLVEEFFVGVSAREKRRTLFAVGDEKQSIYSFQGAAPESFARQNKRFSRAASAVGQSLHTARLNLSFRSTPDVLGAVDRVFSIEENRRGLTFDGDEYRDHTAARQRAPGSVEIWPLAEPGRHEEPDEWSVPVDQFANPHQAVQLANQLADDIAYRVRESRLAAGGASISASDILVLVRSRDQFVAALTRALKERKIAVAGADRLSLTDHIAVLDLMALGQVVLTPQDDLSLAALLKSPLFDFDEDALFFLARDRLVGTHEISLFDALRRNADQEPYSTAARRLTRWMALADQVPVYEFYAQVLGTDGGRRRFLGRLGAEAEDVLDAFLDTTLAHEQSGLPGLQIYLETLTADSHEIKRELDQGSGEVRIMTVHAAKGLEAPIVYLVDKCSPAFIDQHASSLYRWERAGAHGFLWVPETALHGDVTPALKDLIKAKAEEEYRRLLYVGMTRAQDVLIVCGYRGSKLPTQPNWHTMVSEALKDDAREEPRVGETQIKLVWRAPNSPPAMSSHDESGEKALTEGLAPLPPFVHHKLPAEKGLPRPLSPSRTQAVIDERTARERAIPSLLDRGASSHSAASVRERGTALHRLLQKLPEMPAECRWQQAERWLAATLPDVTVQERKTMLDRVRNTLDDHRLEYLFAPETSRAEVSVMGHIDLPSGKRPVSGTIDRMAVLDDRVVLLDYKTSMHVPPDTDSVAPDYVMQMALYRTMIRRLYPDRPVEALLVWTHAPDGPSIMLLEPGRLDAALERLATL